MEKEGDMAESPMRNMKPPKIDETPPDVLSQEDLHKLLAFEKGNAEYGRRGAAIIRLFIDTGARLSEIPELALEDADTVNGVISVMGKGKPSRLILIGNKTANSINRYLQMSRQNTGRTTNALWLERGGGKCTGPSMTTSGVRQLI